jgi:hypothetical protein
MYGVKTLCQQVGLEYNKIHICIYGCVLFWTRLWSPRISTLDYGKLEIGGPKNRGPLPLKSGNEVLAKVVEYEDWMQNGNQLGSTYDPSKIHGVKRWSILYDLPYFKVCNDPLSKFKML